MAIFRYTTSNYEIKNGVHFIANAFKMVEVTGFEPLTIEEYAEIVRNSTIFPAQISHIVQLSEIELNRTSA